MSPLYYRDLRKGNISPSNMLPSTPAVLLFGQLCSPFNYKWTFFLVVKNTRVFGKDLDHDVYLLKKDTTIATRIML